MGVISVEFSNLVHIAEIENGYMITREGNYQYVDRCFYCSTLEECYETLKILFGEE